jgi:enolase-phosphatase E1
MDVEGTTTSISFVHDVLFPYSQRNLASFLKEKGATAEVTGILDSVKKTVREESGKAIATSGCSDVLGEWIKADRKHPALKQLQGLIWQRGFESGELKGHVYPDVPKAFARWKQAGIRLGIYSSGSALAQRLIFRHSTEGDLSSFLEGYFDTEVGPKREQKSYENIAMALRIPAADVLFLSDIPEELAAAAACGCAVKQLVREAKAPPSSFEKIPSFETL